MKAEFSSPMVYLSMQTVTGDHLTIAAVSQYKKRAGRTLAKSRGGGWEEG